MLDSCFGFLNDFCKGFWISDGKIKSREHVVDGLGNAPEALLRLFDGSHQGKLLVRIAGE